MKALLALLSSLGPLRAGLAVLALLVILDAPFARPQVETTTVGFLRSVLGPTLMVMLAFTLALDITMSRVFMLDKGEEERRRYRRILWCEVVLLATMLAAWVPWLRAVLLP